MNETNIQLLLLDVDGVLTDGSVIYGSNGVEIKEFNVKDGLGLRMLQDAGIKVGIITGRSSEALLIRCRDLGINIIYDGIRDKAPLLFEIKKKTGIPLNNMAYMGDDLPDIPVMKKTGVSFAPCDAVEEVLNTATFITESRGGQGAVREVCEMILKSKNLWNIDL